jgi:hypothetical protein
MIPSAPVAGPSTASDGLPAHNPMFPNMDASDDDIAWLNVAENDELEEITNICMQHWQTAVSEA